MSSGLVRVSVADFARGLGDLLDRTLRGERFIVCRHKRPIATLQPLNGVIVQPFEGLDYDVEGSLLGDVSQELEKLSELQRAILRDAVSNGRPTSLPLGHPLQGLGIGPALDDLQQRGFLTRSKRRRGGRVITARGLVLREELLTQAGADPSDCWLGGRGWPVSSP